jgi:hypothetical protein
MEGWDGSVSYWIATTPETDYPRYPGGDLKVEVAVEGLSDGSAGRFGRLALLEWEVAWPAATNSPTTGAL